LRRALTRIAAAMLTIPGMATAWAADTREVRVAIGLSLQPYVIRDKNAGIEYDIIREALEAEGYRMVPVYVPFMRVSASLRHGEVDAAATMQESTEIKAYYSDTHIVYRNYAMSLARNHFKIDSIEDLANHGIDAFQNAKVFLGPRFAAAAVRSKHYSEHAEQSEQNRMLHVGRAEVVVADINIFKFHESELADLDARGVDTHGQISYHDIFPPTPYKVAFASEAVRDAFNRGLAKLRRSGEHERIFERYVARDAGVR
jgi:polar amino acid transport system substrate-binding protein